jgi:hypothetical protein
MRYADAYCTYVEVHDGYVFSGPCYTTGKLHSVFVPSNELYAYRQGALIQDAMPSVSKEDREFLMSGISPEAWDAMFNQEEDQDQDQDQWDYIADQ